MTDTSVPNQAQVKFQRYLAAIALHPSLDTLLLLTTDDEQLRHTVAVMAELLSSIHGEAVRPVFLPSDSTDETLWGDGFALLRDAPNRPRGGDARVSPVAGHGLMLAPENDRTQRLLVLQDLSRIGRVLARTLLNLIGSSCTPLERHGHSRQIRNRTLWLAACDTGRLGALAPSLLARFPLRLYVPRSQVQRLERLRSAFDGDADLAPSAASIDLLRRLRVASGVRLALPTDSALSRLRAQEPERPRPLTRDLALARLAAALATLDGDSEVDLAHIDDVIASLAVRPARQLRKLRDMAGPGGKGGQRAPSGEPPPAEPASPASPVDGDSRDQPLEPSRSARIVGRGLLSVETVVVSPERPPTRIVEQRDPETPPAVNIQPARLPQGWRGEIIGFRSFRHGDSLALMPTLLAALPWQRLRQGDRRVADGGARNRALDAGHMLISRSDLRAWSRAPTPGELLVVVLDVTAVTGTAWPGELAHFLQMAYQHRSPISLILVGANGVNQERAELIQCRGVLDARLRAGLDRSPVKATPLAHGFALALGSIRALVKPMRYRRCQTRLVLLTDGRGNVPLHTSLTGEWSWPAGDLGVKDSLTQARAIAALGFVEIHLLAPRPRYAPQHLEALARALGIVPNYLRDALS
jgi:magnesium chelatase subunit D